MSAVNLFEMSDLVKPCDVDLSKLIAHEEASLTLTVSGAGS